jgi:hypothetical protein
MGFDHARIKSLTLSNARSSPILEDSGLLVCHLVRSAINSAKDTVLGLGSSSVPRITSSSITLGVIVWANEIWSVLI